jgi:hypothetical protein
VWIYRRGDGLRPRVRLLIASDSSLADGLQGRNSRCPRGPRSPSAAFAALLRTDESSLGAATVPVPTVLFGSKPPRSKPRAKPLRRGRAELSTPPCDVVAAPIESVPSSPPLWPVTPAAFTIGGAARLVGCEIRNVLQAIRRTPMTMKLVLGMTLQMKKNRLNQAALEARLRNPMDVILTPNLKKAHGWTPPQTLMIVHQIVIWT